MRKVGLLFWMLLVTAFAWGQAVSDVKCMTLMDVPLEGTDSVFIPTLQAAGFQQVKSEGDDPDTYYFKGDFYGIKETLAVGGVTNMYDIVEIQEKAGKILRP